MRIIKAGARLVSWPGANALILKVKQGSSHLLCLSCSVNFCYGATDSAQLLPLSGSLHYTLRLNSAFDGFAQHFVDNMIAEITVNMTAACALTTQKLVTLISALRAGDVQPVADNR